MKIPLKQYTDLLINYTKPQWSRVLLLTMFLFGGIGLQLIQPQIIRYFIDTARAGGTQEGLTLTALLFIGAALINQVLSVTTTYVSENVGLTATNLLRTDLTSHCLQLDMFFHKAHAPGELIERIDGDVTALANFFSQFLICILGNLILLAGILLLLFREDWRVGMALTGYTVATLAVLAYLRDFAVHHWTAARQSTANLFSFLEERLSGLEDISSRGAKAYVMRGFYDLMRKLLQTYRKSRLASNLTFIVVYFLYVVGYGIGLTLGGYLFKLGAITLGTVYLIVHYTGALHGPMEQIMRQIGDLQKANASIGRVALLFETRSQIQDGPGVTFPSGALSVQFQKVSFGYATDDIVLQDVSFQLSPGKVLGLLGRTGSGKTTISRLLFRFYDPNQGVIRLGDVDIRKAHLSELRKHIGLVTQDVQLFGATVRDNLTFFSSEIDDDRILQVFHELGLFSWYQSLPNGLDTHLKPGGGLSSGEAQLLAFARVFLKDPGLVILDEASSRLDPSQEAIVTKAVDKLLQNRTGIIIAHRLATIQRVDEIMILENGHLREYGERERVMNDPTSYFYSLQKTEQEEIFT